MFLKETDSAYININMLTILSKTLFPWCYMATMFLFTKEPLLYTGINLSIHVDDFTKNKAFCA